MFSLWAQLQLHSGLCLASKSNSWVGYCTSLRPRRLGPIGEGWTHFQIPFQFCSLLGLLPCTLSPLGALLLCLLGPSLCQQDFSRPTLSSLITVYPLLRQSTSKAYGPRCPSDQFQPSSLFSQDSVPKSRGPAIRLPEFETQSIDLLPVEMVQETQPLCGTLCPPR